MPGAGPPEAEAHIHTCLRALSLRLDLCRGFPTTMLALTQKKHVTNLNLPLTFATHADPGTRCVSCGVCGMVECLVKMRQEQGAGYDM